MRIISCIAFSAIFSTAANASELAWPDPKIPVPGSVRSFIASECSAFKGTSEETVNECITREMYGFRAVVEMLTNEEFGERAATRYRGCAAGLGSFGGRFHRRKAECISRAYSIVWRFEYSEEVELRETRKASLGSSPSLDGHKRAIELAMELMDSDYKNLR